MLNPTPGLGPPNGYRHLDKPTKITFTGGSWSDVARKLENYRRSNGMKVGNPAEEVVRQFCSEFPQYCTSAGSRSVVSQGSVGFGNLVVHWIGEISAKGNTNRTVSEEDMEVRARICAACPRQNDWANSCGCDPLKFERLRKYLHRELHIKDTESTQKLLGCDALNEWTRLSVWLKQPPVNKGQPENCWRLR